MADNYPNFPSLRHKIGAAKANLLSQLTNVDPKTMFSSKASLTDKWKFIDGSRRGKGKLLKPGAVLKLLDSPFLIDDIRLITNGLRGNTIEGASGLVRYQGQDQYIDIPEKAGGGKVKTRKSGIKDGRAINLTKPWNNFFLSLRKSIALADVPEELVNKKDNLLLNLDRLTDETGRSTVIPKEFNKKNFIKNTSRNPIAIDYLAVSNKEGAFLKGDTPKPTRVNTGMATPVKQLEEIGPFGERLKKPFRFTKDLSLIKNPSENPQGLFLRQLQLQRFKVKNPDVTIKQLQKTFKEQIAGFGLKTRTDYEELLDLLKENRVDERTVKNFIVDKAYPFDRIKSNVTIEKQIADAQEELNKARFKRLKDGRVRIKSLSFGSSRDILDKFPDQLQLESKPRASRVLETEDVEGRPEQTQGGKPKPQRSQKYAIPMGAPKQTTPLLPRTITQTSGGINVSDTNKGISELINIRKAVKKPTTSDFFRKLKKSGNLKTLLPALLLSGLFGMISSSGDNETYG